MIKKISVLIILALACAGCHNAPPGMQRMYFVECTNSIDHVKTHSNDSFSDWTVTDYGVFVTFDDSTFTPRMGDSCTQYYHYVKKN